jgi:flagellar hook protein FlgE
LSRKSNTSFPNSRAVPVDKTREMDIASIGLHGMQQAEASLNKTALVLAKAGSSEDQVDLSAEMVALLVAKQSFQASAKVVATADDLAKITVSLLG